MNSSEHSNLKQQLIEELSSDNVNILHIKILCSNNPGLISSISTLRIKIWTLLLLGNNGSYYDIDLNQDISVPLNLEIYSCILSENNNDNNNKIQRPDCKEQQVLEADIPRTRSDIEEFRTSLYRNSIGVILHNFCITHNVQYKQGMNEVLAPFLYIAPPTSHGSLLPYSLFEAFLFRYIERFMCVDDSSHLFQAFRLFHLLLMYFDPQLALHLHEYDFSPELYSTQWFLTLYSRTLCIQYVLRIWDMMLTIDDPSFIFFIGLCLLRKRRNDLLLCDKDLIPEIIVKLQFHDEEEIDVVLLEAKELYRVCPRCILRYLRLCCVSTTELMPSTKSFKHHTTNTSTTSVTSSTTTGISIVNNMSDKSTSSTSSLYTLNIHEYDKYLSLQAARVCLMLSTQELINSLAPSILPLGSIIGNYDENKHHNSNTIHEETISMHPIYNPQWVIIDIRSYEESILSGGGTLPRAVQIEPEFLSRPDAFDIWLQHFDGLRGCNICIIDMPPPKWTSVALWKRLLLGEGDNTTTTNNNTNNDIKTFKNKLLNTSTRDLDSKYKDEEDIIIKSDANRAAVQLALALQANSFPNVSVVEGGFPALIYHLLQLKGTVEPVIINHDHDKWNKYLNSTGRSTYNSIENIEFNKIQKNIDTKSINTSSLINITDSNNNKPKQMKDLTKIEIYQYGYKMADKLNHSMMKSILSRKIKSNNNNDNNIKNEINNDIELINQEKMNEISYDTILLGII